MRSAEPWFPGLAGPMTATAWMRFARRGFRPATYGTHRWLAGDPEVTRTEVDAVDLGASLTCRIEVLPASSRIRYEGFGLVFRESGGGETDTAAILSALSCIALVPSLHATITAYLRSLHVLQAPGVNFDVSHSDPEVPFSIFVSVPPPERDGTLRLAESILHECMHLQLTMVEAVLPLVSEESATAFSPWRRGSRPLRGVLHGLYVFSVIDTFFQYLDGNGFLAPGEKALVGKRRSQIAGEVVQVAHLAVAEELTGEGRMMAGRLLRNFGAGELRSL